MVKLRASYTAGARQTSAVRTGSAVVIRTACGFENRKSSKKQKGQKLAVSEPHAKAIAVSEPHAKAFAVLKLQIKTAKVFFSKPILSGFFKTDISFLF